MCVIGISGENLRSGVFLNFQLIRSRVAVAVAERCHQSHISIVILVLYICHIYYISMGSLDGIWTSINRNDVKNAFNADYYYYCFSSEWHRVVVCGAA